MTVYRTGVLGLDPYLLEKRPEGIKLPVGA